MFFKDLRKITFFFSFHWLIVLCFLVIPVFFLGFFHPFNSVRSGWSRGMPDPGALAAFSSNTASRNNAFRPVLLTGSVRFAQ